MKQSSVMSIPISIELCAYADDSITSSPWGINRVASA